VERLCPEALPVFSELSSYDAGATLLVSALLERLDAWEQRAPHDPLFALLLRRGFGPAERERLAALAARARALPETPQQASSSEPDDESSPDLVALHDWLKDWGTTAKTFIARRDWLIRLGLVRRAPRG
jgi:hypothetical protein